MHAQATATLDRAAYDADVRAAHARYPDLDAVLRVAEFQETTLG